MIRYVSDRKFRNLEIIDFGHGTFSSAVDGTTRAREMLRRRKSQIRALTQTGDGVDGLSYLSCDTSDGGEGFQGGDPLGLTLYEPVYHCAL